jgi:hypothetical protein
MPILGIMASQISGKLWQPDGAYDSLATVIVPSGGLASITFAGIPNTYKHLQLRASILGTSSGESPNTRFNGDTTSSNYICHRLNGNGSSASAAAYANNFYFPGTTGSTTAPCVTVTDFLDYANTTKFKTVRSLEGNDTNGGGFINLWSGLWRSTDALNEIKMTLTSGTYQQHSQFSLYGVK